MAMNGQEISQGIRTGTLNLNELREMLGSANATPITIDDWGAAYSSQTGQLSVFGTVRSTSPITGLGLMAYSVNGTTMYALQYSNGFNDTEIMTSIGTTLFNPQSGNQVLSVIYGWTQSGSFYQTRVLDIQSDN